MAVVRVAVLPSLLGSKRRLCKARSLRQRLGLNNREYYLATDLERTLTKALELLKMPAGMWVFTLY